MLLVLMDNNRWYSPCNSNSIHSSTMLSLSTISLKDKCSKCNSSTENRTLLLLLVNKCICSHKLSNSKFKVPMHKFARIKYRSSIATTRTSRLLHKLRIRKTFVFLSSFRALLLLFSSKSVFRMDFLRKTRQFTLCIMSFMTKSTPRAICISVIP